MRFSQFTEQQALKHQTLLKEANERFLTEGGLSRIWQHLQERNIGVITAFRGEYSLQENRQRNSKLESNIRSAGFGFYKANGHYIENYGSELAKDQDEEVFFVIGAAGEDNGKLKGFLRAQGKLWEQDSVLLKTFGSEKATLLGTKAGVWPGEGELVEVGRWRPDKIGEFYTKMKGHTFVFESVHAPKGLMERMTAAAMQRELNKLNAPLGKK